MTYVHVILEVIGILSIIGTVLLLLGACCIGGCRNHLDKFNGPPENYKFSKIRSITRMHPGKPAGKGDLS